MITMLLWVGAVLGIVFGFIAFKNRMIKEYMSDSAQPPQTVSTAKARYEEWQPTMHAVGTLKAAQGADIASEVGGIVTAIHFKQGEEVVQGAPLLQLRSQDDLARMQSLKAAAELARITLERDKAQFQAKAASQQTLDTDAANLAQANANLAEQQALLDKKLIRAPFAGRLGLRLVNVGQYIDAGTPLVTLQTLDTLYADFNLPQQALNAVRVGQTVTVRIDAFPQLRFSGEISVINPKVDDASRNVQIRATLQNAEEKLLPGMYASLEIATGQPERHLTLPNAAIAYNPYGALVYLVDRQGSDDKGQPKLVARESFVTVGESRGDQVTILQGLKEGDQVVTSGQIKLRNGTKLVINDTIRPSEDPAPAPEDE
ncbi:efflux RND transporter periplasmic adaptor subunit [Methylogaea oryzae]|uniref:MexH family multidrug efflux RND transporter periplasmic adaptor subunit n=1 Tax=Methylogaea oryzae TaxID=1295382 RepID=A0A8D4VPI8_9GAMM|nr:efflux RND transporter periplasmic adaptor subunit [Methylogaea oryzae]BBL71332.1 MexH family multidrug efflux RND transporter periplasmic adaptor subunit [Methylogaea oryzae]